MVDVFISYPRVERAKVEPIRDKLEALGLETFFDIHGIDGGDTFPDVIDRALKSAKAVLGVWSPRAFQSKWCMIECRVGATRGVLVPVALERFSELDMKSDFMTTNYLDLSDFDGNENHEGWQRTLRSLSRHVGRGLGDATPAAPQQQTPTPPRPAPTPPAPLAVAPSKPKHPTSNGYLVAATADFSIANEICEGFHLAFMDPTSVDDFEAAGAVLAAANNVGLLLSSNSASDPSFMALARSAAQRLRRAQLILVGAYARAAFAFLPDAWPAMSIEKARERSAELVRQRDAAP